MRSVLLGIGFVLGCGGVDTTLTDGGADAPTNTDSSTSNDSSTGNDAPATSDSGDSGNPATLPCGTSACTSGQECCVDTSNTVPVYTCATTCPKSSTALKCIGNDCGSEVCCVFINAQQQTASQCQPTCGQNEAQLCQASDGGATGCPTNEPCSSKSISDWGLTTPFGTCGGVGN